MNICLAETNIYCLSPSALHAWGLEVLRILLVEPDYYSRYPPLGLLKLSSYHKAKGDTIEYIRGIAVPRRAPDLIYVTSLFTYAWKPVHDAVKFFKRLFPDVKMILGGIYASLLPEHAKMSGADEVHTGLYWPAEGCMPDYDLVPDWDGSILFASRGCIRNCSYCSVPKLEGPPSAERQSISELVDPRHTKVILWDNNILASSNWRAVFDDLERLGLEVDINQGLDARLVSDEVAARIARLKMNVVRLAYDLREIGPYVKRAVERLKSVGVRSRNVIVYTLYNYIDSPQDLRERILDILDWGAVSYPMRFEPLCSLQKNAHVGPYWTAEALELVAKARRVIGYAGAFPPYVPLVNKLRKAENFEEAFHLFAPRSPSQIVHGPALKHNGVVKAGRIGKNVYKFGGSRNWRINNLKRYLDPI
jgi:hypothetical protein